MKSIVFIDSEIGLKDHKIKDLGAIKQNGDKLHTSDLKEFSKFVSKSDFVCAHNAIDHDIRFLKDYISSFFHKPIVVDTLPISPLLFPKKPYHNLLKDDKILTDELNNPLNDAEKCKQLFDNEVSVFNSLDEDLRAIYYGLLGNNKYFSGFFSYVDCKGSTNLSLLIKSYFVDRICANANVTYLINSNPVELAYCLAAISANDKESIIPHWVQKNYPKVDHVMNLLRGTPCKEGCSYCEQKFSAKTRLKEFFGYDDFRTFDGEKLQENAVNAAIRKESILTIFPTGGGKSITFQLPALIAGEASKSLTIVISPLQSLMKDQVDNLSEKGIVDAVTINGMLSPVERAESIERVMNGVASILYISPETLRSKTLERILICRNIDRVVIDEAHCFSSWGQDFRVDYLYIADFIKHLQEIKGGAVKIPVSCFTATAKPKVISDIRDYFSTNLGIELSLYATSSTRKNLSYHVIRVENEEGKYQRLRDLIIQKNCPTIVYTSRTHKTMHLARKLCDDGFSALPYNGKMESKEKQLNQESFKKNETQIMVATSAFGMGVDKDDVKLVVHYDISDSLENYVQEAGRAGRNQSLQADCYVLYNDEDLNNHFLLLNQSKLSIADIRQIWKAIKEMTKARPKVTCSALEIARQAGWDDSIYDIETRVRTAISALENVGYIQRGQNSPRVFATSIRPKSYIEADQMISNHSQMFDENELVIARRVIKNLIGHKYKADAGNDEHQSRVDYLADILGIDKMDIITVIDKLKEIGVLKDESDMDAFVKKADALRTTENALTKFINLEKYMIENMIFEEPKKLDIKEFIDQAVRDNVKDATEKNIKTILYFWKLKEFIKKESQISTRNYVIYPLKTKTHILTKVEKRNTICYELVKYLYEKARQSKIKEEILVHFSMNELLNIFNDSLLSDTKADIKELQDALLYLHKIHALTLEGGFLVLYNAMEIEKLVDNKIKYTIDNYKQLNEFYNLKIQQIHIVGEYANMMCEDIQAAQAFVHDYFNMDYSLFIKKYFKTRANEIKKNITAAKYNKIFGHLSSIQRNIIDDESKYITVIAGPGSGKTMVLVHKLASLLLLEDVKSEQLLMLTFSRAAATEFKERLISLIGPVANYVEIKTFHSYCFDLLGKLGNEEEFNNVVPTAIEMIRNDEVEMGKITKSVLVIDEAQDMDSKEYELIQELINYNEEMRVIMVGDDDQNIYEFRGSNSKYMQELMEHYSAKKYEMLENYRSVNKIVNFSNLIANKIKYRIKEHPVVSVRKDNGLIEIVKHSSPNMEEAILNHIKTNQNDLGKIAILTKTNIEALRIVGLLLKNKIDAKLIQDFGDFKLGSLDEFRHLIELVNKNMESPVITDDEWEKALDELNMIYKNSKNYEVLSNLLNTFSSLYKTKYRTDLIEFINESKYDDFIETKKTKVVVSTIHKSKGKEFDTVYLSLNEYSLANDEKVRDLYVGLTRAKTNLFINYYGKTFDSFNGVPYIRFKKDETVYSEPDELSLLLSHKDVHLGYFKNEKGQQYIKDVISGCTLEYKSDGLYLRNSKYPCIKFSAAFNSTLNKLVEEGFKIAKSSVRFVCYWKDPEEIELKEYKVLLPIVKLSKNEEIETSPTNEHPSEPTYLFDDFKDPRKTESKIETKTTSNVEKKPTHTPEEIAEKEGFSLIYSNDKCLTKVSVLTKLRSLRAMLAEKEKLPAYCIVSNETLVHLATYLPVTKEQFVKIKGLGPIKYEKYGGLFINLIAKYKDL